MNRHFHRLIKRLSRDEDGAVAIIFGLSLIPLMALTGVAVDYSRASQLRSKMATAADAAVLSAVRIGNATLAERRTIADAVFAANLGTDASLGGVTGTLVPRSNGVFRYEASATYNYAIMQAIPGAGTYLPLSVNAEAIDGGLTKLEIVLVMDNTGSMGSANKMSELKRALCGNTTCNSATPTSGFVKLMRDAARDADQIRVALVPFDTTVRVPLNVQQAVNAGTNAPTTLTYTGSDPYTGSGYCNANTTDANRVNWSLAGAPPVSWFRFANRDRDTSQTGSTLPFGCTSTRPQRATWQGCVWDRDQDDNRDTTPAGVDVNLTRTLYPAVNCRTASLARMIPLVDVKANTAQLITAMASMTPSGNTNVTIGTTWGANMLVPGFPMSTAAAQDPSNPQQLQKYMIVLTDGDNTESKQSWIRSDIDPRTLLACSDAKARGITVYTVRVINGNQDLLRACASSPDNYYSVANASQLTNVFASIANRIGSVRLTQ